MTQGFGRADKSVTPEYIDSTANHKEKKAKRVHFESDKKEVTIVEKTSPIKKPGNLAKLGIPTQKGIDSLMKASKKIGKKQKKDFEKQEKSKAK